VLARNVCSRLPITMKSHDLHLGDIRRVVGEITSYHENDKLLPFFGSYGLHIFGLPFCLLCDDFIH
jgi:hypothetical protein